MKYTIALLASAQAYNLNNQEVLYQATRSLEESSLVQLEEGKVLETTLPAWNGWHPNFDGFPGTVNEFGNYFVGSSLTLVHDNTFRRPTPSVVPGLQVLATK